MKIVETPIQELVVIETDVFRDERGTFRETCHRLRMLEKLNVAGPFAQSNISESKAGVIRGLHYQSPPFSQAKLVHCIRGGVYDIAVDLRTWSKSYGQWYGTMLNDVNHRQMFVPRGFAHGFLAMTEDCIFGYDVFGANWEKSHEGGIRFDDPDLNIDWSRQFSGRLIVSEKDRKLPHLKNVVSPFKQKERW